jgi:hypothetical protein
MGIITLLSAVVFIFMRKPIKSVKATIDSIIKDSLEMATDSSSIKSPSFTMIAED